MANLFTNAGEFKPGKGGKKTRLGPKQKIDTVKRQKPLTPDGIALNKLGIILGKTDMDGESIKAYIKLMSRSDQIRFMNMNTLAQVLLYMQSVNDVLNETTFNSERINPYVMRALSKYKDKSEDGKDINSVDFQISKLRMENTFFKYFRYVKILKTRPVIGQTPIQYTEDVFTLY